MSSLDWGIHSIIAAMAPAEGGLYAEQDVWSRQQMLAGEELLLPPLPPPKITVRVRHEADKYRVNLTREEAPAHVVYPHVLRCVSTWSARAGRGERTWPCTHRGNNFEQAVDMPLLHAIFLFVAVAIVRVVITGAAPPHSSSCTSRR